jgi:protein-S-isoprenylcysteine O-methyltransferase Ste14
MIISKLRKIMSPTYLLIFLILSIVFHLIVPIKSVIVKPYNLLGIIFISIGIWFNIQTDNLFRKNETTVKPEGETSVLIISGPFKYSRHPMYLGMLLITIGMGILLGSIASFLPSLSFSLVLEFIFVRFEEDKLEKVFGQEYIKYKKKVRSWI